MVFKVFYGFIGNSRPYAAKGSSINDDDEAALREVGGQEEGKLLLVPRCDQFFPLSLPHFSCFDKLFPWYCHTFLCYQFAAGWQPGIHTPA